LTGQIFDIYPCLVSHDLLAKDIPPLENEFCLVHCK